MPLTGVSRARLVDNVDGTTAQISGDLSGYNQIYPTVGSSYDAAEAEYVLRRFIEGVSPGRKVRAAAGKPGAWLNFYPSSIPLDQVTIGRPVTVYLTRWSRQGCGSFVLLVFDLDAGSAGRAQVLADAAALTRALAAHGIRCVPVVSGPTGGMHLWAACPEGLDAAVVARIARTAERLYPSLDTSPLTNSGTGGVRPPGSLHRAGGYARLAEHTVEEAVSVLQQGADRDAWISLLGSLEAMAAYPALLSESRIRAAGPQLAQVRHHGHLVPPSIAARGPVIRPITTDDTGRIKLDRPWRPLSAKALAALRRRPQDRPGAHSAAVHVHLKALALCGGSYSQLRELIADDELSPALEWLRTSSSPAGGRVPLTELEADRRAARAWYLAVQAAARVPKRPTDDLAGFQPVADTPGARASADLVARIHSADPAQWARPSGTSDLNTLYAVAYKMAFSGSDEVSVDARGMGVLIGRGKSTAALAINRVLLDGWFEETSEADPTTFTARRIRLADAHECPDSPHHVCAIHQAPASDETAGQSGLDGTVNTPPLGGGVQGFDLERRIAFQQSGLWTAVGHTVGRTLAAIEEGVPTAKLTTATGYRSGTSDRHLGILTALALITWDIDAQGRSVIVRTGRTLYEAAAQCGTATLPGERATAAYVDRLRWAWCLRDIDHCRLTGDEKRRMGPRAAAGQLVLAGQDPHGRAYPRTADGEWDHAAAWELEALRTGAVAIALAADARARAGQVVDPARLLPAAQAAEQPHQAAEAAA